MKELVIKTIKGLEIVIKGTVTKKVINNEVIYYCNGNSYPEEIVVEVR